MCEADELSLCSGIRHFGLGRAYRWRKPATASLAVIRFVNQFIRRVGGGDSRINSRLAPASQKGRLTMAKHTTPAASQPLVIGAIFALTYWRSKDNERSELEDTKELKNSLARHGWSAQYPVAVIPIPTSASLNEEQKKAGVKTPFDDCMEERKALWEKHKAATDADGLVKKAVWERMFVRDGKLIEPKYLGNMGFRRSSCFVDAMVQRWNDSTVPDGEKVADVIPLMVKVYASEADRIIDQQLEN